MEREKPQLPKCKVCGKTAIVHVEEIIAGSTRISHFCEKHAAEYLKNPPPKDCNE